jgi:site-specific recombinase XerD
MTERDKPIEPLDLDEIRALLKACSKKAPTGIRDAALIAVMYGAGLRVSEALNLLPRDLNAKDCSIRVRNGKGGKSRLVGMDPSAWALLDRWLDVRKQLGFNGGGKTPVFCTLKGTRIAPQQINEMLYRRAENAGLGEFINPKTGKPFDKRDLSKKRAKYWVGKRVHPHGLRHTHAFELANENTPLHVIQQQLGHSNVGTTSRYIEHLNPKAVIDTIAKRERKI